MVFVFVRLCECVCERWCIAHSMCAQANVGIFLLIFHLFLSLRPRIKRYLFLPYSQWKIKTGCDLDFFYVRSIVPNIGKWVQTPFSTGIETFSMNWIPCAGYAVLSFLFYSKKRRNDFLCLQAKRMNFSRFHFQNRCSIYKRANE